MVGGPQAWRGSLWGAPTVGAKAKDQEAGLVPANSGTGGFPGAVPSSWDRVLWRRQPYPDNYVDASFLSQLRTNATAQFPRFLSIALFSLNILQQLCIVVLFVSLFVHLYHGTIDASVLVWVSVGVTGLLACAGTGYPLSLKQSIPGVLVLSFTLYSLSPVVRTFSEATTSDSVWACAAVLFFGHLAFADYRMNASSLAQLASTISLNMGMCASVVLSSRLRVDLDVFALLLVALQLFALYPLLRTRVYQRFGCVYTEDGYSIPCASIPLTIALLGTSMYAMLPHSRLVALYLHPIVTVFVGLLCPLWMRYTQRWKREMRGPWDEAVVGPSGVAAP